MSNAPLGTSARPMQAQCQSCGYNLTGLRVLRCPECGTYYSYAQNAIVMQARTAGRGALVTCLVACFLLLTIFSAEVYIRLVLRPETIARGQIMATAGRHSIAWPLAWLVGLAAILLVYIGIVQLTRRLRHRCIRASFIAACSIVLGIVTAGEAVRVLLLFID